MHLPVDYLCSDLSIKTDNPEVTVQDNRSGISSNLMGLDIGPETLYNYK